jgi:hypothetical protein
VGKKAEQGRFYNARTPTRAGGEPPVLVGLGHRQLIKINSNIKVNFNINWGV